MATRQYGDKRPSCGKRHPILGLQISNVISNWAIVGLLIGLLAGGYGTVQIMTRMDGGMSLMTKRVTDGGELVDNIVKGLSGKFPANQPEVTTRQVLAMIENANRIAARTQYLLQHLEPEGIGQTVHHFNKIMGAMSGQEIQSFKTSVLNTAKNLEKITASINPADVARVVQKVGQLDTVQFNLLAKTVAKIHEIKIQLFDQ